MEFYRQPAAEDIVEYQQRGYTEGDGFQVFEGGPVSEFQCPVQGQGGDKQNAGGIT